MEIKNLLMATAIIAVLPAEMHGQQADRDTLSANGNNQEHYTFEWRKTALPVSLMGAGAIALAPSFVRHSSRTVTRDIIDLRGGGRRLEFDDNLQYLPVVGSLFLGCTGIKARHSFRDRALIVATSYATLGVLTNIPKLCINEKRPEFESRNSFPSGHTCAAFAAGLSWARTLPWRWSRILAVILAVCMGLSRLYVGVHYPSDVIAGALVGAFCAWAAWKGCGRLKHRGENRSSDR